MADAKKYAVEIGGKKISVEISRLAEQANGSVIVRYGETIVMVSCVMAKSQREGIDFFPLLVDYEERFYAAGKILGSRFIKREGRPTEDAILNARLIDRSIRPRFDQRMRNDVQVVAVILSYDGQNDPDVAALIGASAALSISNIPWDGPVAGVRVGRVDGKFIINPTNEEREKSDFDLLVAGMAEKINMIEAGAKEVPEPVLLEAMEIAQKEIKKLVDFQNSIVEEINPQKAKIELKETNSEVLEILRKHFSVRLEDALFEKDKTARQIKVDELKSEWKTSLKERFGEDEIKSGLHLFDIEIDHIVHKNILGKGKRPDGRKTDELRELSAQAGFLPRAHGSGVFVRGQTKALSVLTLGGPGDQQFMEGMEFKGWKRFMHHYNFPGYSVGEVSPIRSTGRREIGHGALAEKALRPLIPDELEFPYTIRIVSEIFSSNGSSSMASVCGSTIALMDAGVQIKNPAAGIAMGLMMDEEGNYKVLTDIQGPEDHHGDMDFKCAGTKEGVTALQMDVKIEGVTLKILKDTLEQAREARLEILETILKEISAPRPELSKYAPRILSLKIDPEKIGRVIGPGGKMINEIIAVTGAAVDIEDDGSVFITAEKVESAQKAYDWVKGITHEAQAGEVYEGTVTRVMDFGAFVEILPGQEGLVHISELAKERVNRVEDVVRAGDKIKVKIKEIDNLGRINLSRKTLL